MLYISLQPIRLHGTSLLHWIRLPLPCSKDCSLPFIFWGQQAHWFIPWGQPCAARCQEQSPPTGWSAGWSPCLSRQRTICEFLRRENLYWSFWRKQFLGIILCSSSPMSWRAGLRFAEKSNFILGSSSPALVISIFWKISSKSNEAKVRSSSSNAASPSWLGLGEKSSCLIVKKNISKKTITSWGTCEPPRSPRWAGRAHKGGWRFQGCRPCSTGSPASPTCTSSATIEWWYFWSC